MSHAPSVEQNKDRVVNDEPTTMPECDILLPVHNALSFAREAITSVFESTRRGQYRLLIIDDGSDLETAARLAQIANTNEGTEVLRLPENRGFVEACSLGYKASNAEFMILLNSDVVVTPGWLERLLLCARSDSLIASVNPLTNHASQLAIPMPPGANYVGIDTLLRLRQPTYPDVVTGVGFCLLLRRSAIEQVGFLDPVFGRGYCEDSDLCMRLTSAGYRTVVADDVYVYHRGSATFGETRQQRYLSNRKIFDERWGPEYRTQFSAFRKQDPLRDVRSSLALETVWDPMPSLWMTGRSVFKATRKLQPINALKSTAQGLLHLTKSRRSKPDAQAIERVTRPDRLTVTYILHRLVVAGGVLSVIQIVNELIRLGVEARIITLFEDPLIYQWTKLYTKPIVVRNPKELIANFPRSDVVVATLWSTAPWVHEIRKKKLAKTGVYFIQDYEPWFFPPNKRRLQARVSSTYGLIEHRIVKSDWLAGQLQADGYSTKKISIGMDLDTFYPRDAKPTTPIVLAMARPHTPRRGFPVVIDALARIKASRPEVEIHLFGDSHLDRHKIPFSYVDHGVITDQQRMARVYSDATVFVDGSDFQGFGRCGLEAMACGTSCVLTEVGGVNEYAISDKNCSLVPPGNPETISRAILDLLDRHDHRKELISAGLLTVQKFSHKREARETLDYFKNIQLGKKAR
ncbi:glycosyltransferase [Lamprobacter modestohalophilus]|uniref:glycosyltransferase n=1 Tax=Lamprobacter modestohalophilus TaxID=1064514 RepID=UPI002ADED7FF|nr:glycosyltransferase [Lamprobacter modestohalophilus]MEA1052538.1 glycosyltransferase [Lamprobacter modestohalophilus]